MEFISIKESIPVTYDVDVVVAGGGPAGIGAAMKAAQSGKKVLLIEQSNCLGGVAGSGLHGHICCYDAWNERETRVVGGTCYDIAMRVVDDGYGTYDGYGFDFEVEWFKHAVEVMMEETGNIQILYYTQFSDVVVENDRIQSVIIQNKSGRQAVKTKMVIDTTGDADVAAKAGVPFEKGRKEDGSMQPMTLMFQIGDIDHDAYLKFARTGYMEKYKARGAEKGDGYRQVFLEAQENGDMEPFQTKVMGFWWTATRPDQIGVNFTHIVGKDPTSAEDLTYATIEGRRQAYETVKVFRSYIPGFEKAWVSHSGAVVGTRESRRICGEYCITVNDLMEEKEFSDSIGYGSFFIDIHNCTGPGMDTETYYPRKGFKYQIPYRALVPVKIDNLLAAGRCISCDHDALGSLRVMPQCYIEGDAAGVAAAIAIEKNIRVGDVAIDELQDRLHSFEAILKAEDIVVQEVK